MGKPIIAYSIEAAIKSGLFDEIMVSTEDEEIASIAQFYGANVPNLRSQKNASDHATTAEVLTEVIESYQAKNINFHYACCIYPTTPFLSIPRLREAYRKIRQEQLDCVMPVVPFEYPIQRAYRMQKGLIQMVNPEHKNTRSQDLEKRYHDCGQFYWFNPKTLIEHKSLLNGRTGAIIVPQMEVQDIDEEDDWRLAELKYQLISANYEN